MELSGLEVAVEKVSFVIQSVCKQLFNINLTKADLPSPTTVKKHLNLLTLINDFL
jgi:hypothetical protein